MVLYKLKGVLGTATKEEALGVFKAKDAKGEQRWLDHVERFRRKKPAYEQCKIYDMEGQLLVSEAARAVFVESPPADTLPSQLTPRRLPQSATATRRSWPGT